jgi:hypothetical protein
MELSGHLHAPVALSPRKEDQVPIVQEPVWKQSRSEKSLVPAGTQTRGVQPVASRYTDWDIMAILFKHPVALIYEYNLLHIITFPFPMQHFFLTTCFGRIRPSSGLFYFSKIVVLYGMSIFHIEYERDIF